MSIVSVKHNFPIIAKVPVIVEDKQAGVIKFGENNKLPNEIITGILASGTASNCANKIASFVEADGFTDPAISKRRANRKQTFDQLLQFAAPYLALFPGVYFQVMFNMAGEPAEVNVLPYEQVRIKLDGSFEYNKNFGKKGFKKGDTVDIPKFTGGNSASILSEQLLKHGKQLGAIHYVHIPQVGIEEYAIGTYYAGFEDIESDAALQVLERSKIKRGFKTDVIISTGEIDAENKDEAGKTDADYLGDKLRAFTAEDAPSILHLDGATPEMLPTVTVFPLKDLLNGVDQARNRVGRAVCRHFGVPPIIVGFEQPEGWGNNNALVNNMKLFNRMVLKLQNLLSGGLSFIFPGVDFTISTLNLVDFIPPEVWAVLTEEEKRAAGGYEPLEKKQTTESENVLNALNTLSPLVANKVLESMSPEEIRGLIGLKGTYINPNPPAA